MANTCEEHLRHPSPEPQQEPPEELNSVVPGDGSDSGSEQEEAPPPAPPVWPPSQWAREAMSRTLAESLSSPFSIFKRYGPVPHEEAAAVARRIEQEAFAAVSPAAPAFTAEEMETLYTKELSRRLADFCIARRAASSSPSPASTRPETPPPPPATTSDSDKAPPLESGASQV